MISTEGMSVLPGLWDMHVHLMINGHADYAHWDKTYPAAVRAVIMPASAKQLLLAGVTSARDLGAPLEASIAVRDAINAARSRARRCTSRARSSRTSPTRAPSCFAGASTAPTMRAPRSAKLADGRRRLHQADRPGPDDDGRGQAVVDEAHKRGLPVVAHSHRPEEIRRGLAAGVDYFEHTGLSSAPEYPDGRHRA